MFRFLPLAALLLAISCADLEIHLKYGATCIMDHGVAIQQSLSIRELISENTTSIDLGGMDIQTFLILVPYMTISERFASLSSINIENVYEVFRGAFILRLTEPEDIVLRIMELMNFEGGYLGTAERSFLELLEGYLFNRDLSQANSLSEFTVFYPGVLFLTPDAMKETLKQDALNAEPNEVFKFSLLWAAEMDPTTPMRYLKGLHAVWRWQEIDEQLWRNQRERFIQNGIVTEGQFEHIEGVCNETITEPERWVRSSSQGHLEYLHKKWRDEMLFFFEQSGGSVRKQSEDENRFLDNLNQASRKIILILEACSLWGITCDPRYRNLTLIQICNDRQLMISLTQVCAQMLPILDAAMPISGKAKVQAQVRREEVELIHEILRKQLAGIPPPPPLQKMHQQINMR